MISKEVLGKRIREIREYLDMSQNEFAQITGLTQIAISRCETGSLSIDNLLNIINTLSSIGFNTSHIINSTFSIKYFMNRDIQNEVREAKKEILMNKIDDLKDEVNQLL